MKNLSTDRETRARTHTHNRKQAEEEANAAKNPGKGERMESCSCIEGNPCADAYCCKVA